MSGRSRRSDDGRATGCRALTTALGTWQCGAACIDKESRDPSSWLVSAKWHVRRSCSGTTIGKPTPPHPVSDYDTDARRHRCWFCGVYREHLRPLEDRWTTDGVGLNVGGPCLLTRLCWSHDARLFAALMGRAAYQLRALRDGAEPTVLLVRLEICERAAFGRRPQDSGQPDAPMQQSCRRYVQVGVPKRNSFARRLRQPCTCACSR